ncbi:hypothetical protein JXB11_03825 [Candidatus Woesearchaeota archaeon]|nr:hypothetical protein [Candidatus Woesearchaeota archaeon]
MALTLDSFFIPTASVADRKVDDLITELASYGIVIGLGDSCGEYKYDNGKVVGVMLTRQPVGGARAAAYTLIANPVNQGSIGDKLFLFIADNADSPRTFASIHQSFSPKRFPSDSIAVYLTFNGDMRRGSETVAKAKGAVKDFYSPSQQASQDPLREEFL